MIGTRGCFRAIAHRNGTSWANYGSRILLSPGIGKIRAMRSYTTVNATIDGSKSETSAMAGNTTTDISSAISSQNLLQGTGSGPFIELPQFSPVGHGHDLLNVKMPQSSNLNIRTGALIAMNGDLDGLTSTNRQLEAGLSYQVLQSEESVSLVIGGKSRSNSTNNYSIIDIEDSNSNWVVLNDENIVAWTGYDFELTPTKILQNWNSIKAKGRGKILVNDYNKTVQLELGPQEKMLVIPNSVVATNGTMEFVALKDQSITWPTGLPKNPFSSIARFLTSLITVPYRQLSQRSKTIRDVNESISEYTTRAKYFAQNTMLFIRLHLINRLFNKTIFMEVSGPSTVVMSTNTPRANGKVFTKEEINEIFSRAK